ncbi:eukaryotic translation initiation factor 5B [Ischnura elegans]|uniref:eukaryotic translation initiation factor 5B n=1 Tax=Ischnura elegans TaxID=197161 RepID=UPI001ED8AABD|nr:eukaryotic translation initiation factor 5B [Ischnura elegans]
MGKAKKGKKGGKEEEVDDEYEVETSNLAENASTKGKDKKGKPKNEEENEPKQSEDDAPSKKKGKKERKKKSDDEDDDVDDITKAVESINIAPSEKKGKKDKKPKKEEKLKAEDSDDEPVVTVKKGKEKKKKVETPSDDSDDGVVSRVSAKPKAGFALLAADSDDDEADNVVPQEPSEDEEVVEQGGKKGAGKKKGAKGGDEDEAEGNKKAGKKGKKKSRRKDDDDEEDIEKMLAELEFEYTGVKKEGAAVDDGKAADGPAGKEAGAVEKEAPKKKEGKKKDEKKKEEEVEGQAEAKEGDEAGGTVKTAAQKKKEKKEREKQKKLALKKQEEAKPEEEGAKTEEGGAAAPPPKAKKAPAPEKTAAPPVEKGKVPPKDAAVEQPKAEGTQAAGEAEPAGEDDDADGDDKKKKKKKGAKEVKEDDKKKGPGKKTIAAMQEALKKMKEEEERLAREEEERLKRLEEAEQARLEQLRLEQERKERKKLKEKERKERLKAEGKLLTARQKADKARAQAMLEALRAQGVKLPEAGTTPEKRAPRPGTRIRPKGPKQQQQQQTGDSTAPVGSTESKVPDEKRVEVKIVDKVEMKKDEEDEGDDDRVKDSWDAESTDDEQEDEEKSKAEEKADEGEEEGEGGESGESESDEEDSEEESSSSEEDDDEDDSEESEEEHKTDAERRREKALARIKKRREENEKIRTVDVLRAAVICVLGHVDTGKTKILDKLRRTNVQDGEAGGITQQIGATNVPMDAIKEQTKIVKGFADFEMRIPGLLIIDTPGHESFSNLRSRGSSLCDMAVLVVDIMHGLEPQTLESIGLLKARKTPFVVALNKIDRLYDWQTFNRRDIRDVLKSQAANTQLEFEQRTKEVIVQFAEQGLNAALFFENPDPRTYVSLVPTSAITGEGMGNLLALLVQNCQNMLAKRLMFSEELQATVLEVKAIPGLGTTIDAILVNGRLREGDTMILAGTDGPVVTQIRSLLMPQPMKELRVKNAYIEYKEIQAAQGVKIAAKDLEKSIAGLNLLVANHPDEVEILRDEVAKELSHALNAIKLQERGVYVQASTLGSLEALLEFLRTSKIPYSGIRIGPVVKKDVVRASAMLEHESQYATILAFDVKVERDAQELADTLGVKIFQADIIYHLFDKFTAYRDELRQRKRDQFKHIAVFPCKLKVLPQFIFNSRDPIVVGVMVEAGVVKEGTPICVPSKEFVEIGIVTSIEVNHKNVESARKGQEVCVKIEAIPGEAPKMFGRHFDEKDLLISKISRQSIDACKDYFRDDLLKTDWQLMVELKKLFQIL